MTPDRWAAIIFAAVSLVFSAGVVVTQLRAKHETADKVHETEQRYSDRERAEIDRRISELRDDLRRLEGAIGQQVKDVKTDVDGLGTRVRTDAMENSKQWGTLMVELAAQRVKIRALQDSTGAPSLDRSLPTPEMHR
jgi:hypothetical protein